VQFSFTADKEAIASKNQSKKIYIKLNFEKNLSKKINQTNKTNFFFSSINSIEKNIQFLLANILLKIFKSNKFY